MPFLRRLRSWIPRRSASAAECIADFLRRPEHGWIFRDEPFRDSLIELFAGFPLGDLRKILIEERLLLLYCNGKMSCALYPYEGRAMVLVFPDLYRLMTSAHYHQAHAILAHELGHVIHGHARVEIDALAAQLEADRYAWQRGFGEELSVVLAETASGAEREARLAALSKLAA